VKKICKRRRVGGTIIRK